MLLSVYGARGFIGNKFMSMYHDICVDIPRDQDCPQGGDTLYFISTTSNYNIFTEPHLDIETNLNKLIRVLEAHRKNGTKGVFNFISSWFVYGKNCTMNTTEDTVCDPRGFYSITKRAAEQMLVSYCETYGMPYRIMRLTNIIGVGDRKASSKRNALQYMLNLLREGQPVRLYDGGECYRDFMDVDDACRAIMRCVQCLPPGGVINISNSEPTTIKDVIEYSKCVMNSSSEIIAVETPVFHSTIQVKNVCLNNKKLLSLGYLPESTTYKAIDKIIASLRPSTP